MIEAFRKRSFTEKALIVSACASALLLAGAHLFEAFGYVPCPLCLDQREAHWLALGVALAGLVLHIVFRAPIAAAAAVGAAALVYAVSAGLAFYHAGVEWKFWPGPKSCAALGDAPATTGALGAALASGELGPSCEEAQWRLLGVSMAGYNLLASAGLLALTLGATLAAAGDARRARRPHAQPAARLDAREPAAARSESQ
jgi:disulfide bond formation protein DsbB